MLTPKDIQAFKQLYAEKYGVELSDAEVVEITTKALTLLERVLRPLPGEEAELPEIE